jgi:prepilin-type N-terminal cleavage/methylation domain-containing protein
MRRNVCVRENDGFTLLEVIFVTALIAVVSSIAIPSVLRGRAAANEAATIGTIRTIHTAQLTYALSCGVGLYAPNFPALGEGPGAPAFLPPDLTRSLTPTKAHYKYTLEEGVFSEPGPTDCNGVTTTTEYYTTAIPDLLGQNGNRVFASNQAHVIWQDDATGVPPPEPFMEDVTIQPIE